MKCPICGEEVAGDPIAHIKTQSHEVALAKLVESEKSTPPNKVLHQTATPARVPLCVHGYYLNCPHGCHKRRW